VIFLTKKRKVSEKEEFVMADAKTHFEQGQEYRKQ
jgi:hypothetical protein